MKQAPAKKYLSPWNLLYFVLGVIILVLLLRRIDFASLIQLVLKINPGYLVLGGVIYLGKALVRSLRFTRVNARTNPSYLKMLRLSLASSLASQLLPLKLGELSYVYLLQKDNRSSIPQGLSTLMIVRIFDLLAISLLFIGISLVTNLPADLSIYFYSILGFIGFLFLLILGLLIVSRNGRAILQFVSRSHIVERILLYTKLRSSLEGIFDDLKQYQAREYFEWTVLASLEWFINYFTFYFILVGIGFTPTFFDTVVGVTFAALASVLPVNSFGNFGTQEAGWATGLVLMGYNQEMAIASGFATHFLTLFYMLIFGGISWLTYLISGKTHIDAAGEVHNS